MHQQSRLITRSASAVGVVGMLVVLAACAPSSAPPPPADTGVQIGIPDADYTLDALIAAAKKENPITVVDATGKIVEMAENFSAKYGIQATGVKLSASEQEEVLIREAEAKNVQSDVFNMSNLPSVTSQFLPQGIGVSWMPPDLVDETAVQYQSPPITSLNPWVWSYNTEVYDDGCPIDNMWALTDDEWAGKVAIPDPLLRNETMFWFNQIETHGDDLMRDAYEEYFGEPLGDEVESATAEWVARFAANSPTVTKSDSDVGPIVGAPGQTDPFMGFLSAAIFGDAEESGYFLGVCTGMSPWIGQLTPRVAVIAAGTDSPNAAKLFVHYMMTAEGMTPQMADGKLSTNKKALPFDNEPSGVFAVRDELYVNDSSTTQDDFARLLDWQDLWTVSSR